MSKENRYTDWSGWVLSDKKLGDIERDEVWIQHAIEHYRHTHGQFPYKLSVAVTSRPNAVGAMDRLGWDNVDYQLHPTRGYLLTFVKRRNHPSDGNGSQEVEVRVEDHETFLANLTLYQQQTEDFPSTPSLDGEMPKLQRRGTRR